MLKNCEIAFIRPGGGEWWGDGEWYHGPRFRWCLFNSITSEWGT